MEILDLYIFCDLIELKSFTAAAKKNNLTQSAVSQRINKLNEYYGNKIFLNKKQLILSWHGKYLYEKFKDILSIYSHTEEIIEHKLAKEVVSLGFSENAKDRYFNQEFINWVLVNNFQLEIYFSSSRSVYEKVIFGSLDYGIVGSRPQKSSDIAFDILYTEKIVLVTSSTNRCKKVKLEEIPLIIDHRDSGLYLFLKNKLMNFDIDINKLNIISYIGTSIDKLLVIKNRDYYSLLPEWYIRKKPDFKIVDIGFDIIREFYEIYQKKQIKKVAFISEFIRQYNNYQI